MASRMGIVCDLVELFLGWSAEVNQDDRVGLVQVLRHVGDREVLGVEDALSVDPRVGLAHAVLHAGAHLGFETNTKG